MTIEWDKVRPGDKLTIVDVEVVTLRDHDGQVVNVLVDLYPGGARLDVSSFVKHTPSPSPIQVGDFVKRLGHPGERLVVLSVFGSWAAAGCGNSVRPFVWELDSLVLIERGAK